VTARDLFSVVRTQRAHRTFTNEAVPDEMVERVLEAATYAPSAENTQPWVFIVVRDAGARARIGELTRRQWEGGGRDHSIPRLSRAMFEDVERGAMGGIAEAPVIIVVGADMSRVIETVMEPSIFPAIQNLLLAANALGLGAALTTLTTSARELQGLLAFPEHVRPVAVVPLGWPSRKLGPPKRAPVAEKAFREKYGQPWSD
jgi:nitroreductase